jgi:hypothetical protein
MKIFLRENKGKWIALLFLMAYLVGIRYVNVYHVWYTLTPWQNLGKPPKEPVKIMEIKLPDIGEKQPFIVYVKGQGRDFFGCCSLTDEKGWAPSDKPYYKFYGTVDPGPGWCAALIRAEWGVDENLQGIKQNLDAGRCYPYFQYAVYQIKQNGTVRGKTFDERNLNAFTQVSFDGVLCLVLVDLVLLALAVKKEIHESKLKLSGARLILASLSLIAIGAIVFRYFSDINEKIKREIPGEYVRSFVTFADYTLTIHPNRSYSIMITAENRDPFKQDGKFVVENGRIRFPSLINDMVYENIFSGNAYFIPIRWDERTYLVEDKGLVGFCDNHFDSEPREYPRGLYYLRQGDWNLPAEGEPVFMDGRKACP